MREGVCKNCAEKKLISQHNLCKDCVEKKMASAIEQLQMKKGEVFEKWQRNIISAAQKKG